MSSANNVSMCDVIKYEFAFPKGSPNESLTVPLSHNGKTLLDALMKKSGMPAAILIERLMEDAYIGKAWKEWK